jgi:glucoamylase
VVHHLARDSQRDLLPDDRPAADPRHGASDHGRRDLKHEFAYIDSDALGARITSRDGDGRYTLTKEIINDPHYPVVLIRVRLAGEKDFLSRLQVYALLSPHVDGGGKGNSARTLMVAGQMAALAW